MKLTAETVTKDNVIEYLERKDIDNNIDVDEYKEEIVFDDFYGYCEFKKNYENLINKNRDEGKDKDRDKEREKKRKSFIDVIFSSSVLPFIILAILYGYCCFVCIYCLIQILIYS